MSKSLVAGLALILAFGLAATLIAKLAVSVSSIYLMEDNTHDI